MSSMKNALPIIIAFLLIGIVAVSAINYFTFDNNGTVATYEAQGYIGESETPFTEINWDPILPGESDTQLITVKNTGSLPTAINLEQVSWTPIEAETFVTLTWNLAANYVLAVDGETLATLTLAITEGAEDLEPFTLVARIVADEVP